MKFIKKSLHASSPDILGRIDRQTDTTKPGIECAFELARSGKWVYPSTAWFSQSSLSFEIVCPKLYYNSDRLFEINFHSFTSSIVFFVSDNTKLMYNYF